MKVQRGVVHDDLIQDIIIWGILIVQRGLAVYDDFVDGIVDDLRLAEGLQEEVELVLNVNCEHDAGCIGTGLELPEAIADTAILPASGHRVRPQGDRQ